VLAGFLGHALEGGIRGVPEVSDQGGEEGGALPDDRLKLARHLAGPGEQFVRDQVCSREVPLSRQMQVAAHYSHRWKSEGFSGAWHFRRCPKGILTGFIGFCRIGACLGMSERISCLLSLSSNGRHHKLQQSCIILLILSKNNRIKNLGASDSADGSAMRPGFFSLDSHRSL
jgi:hypothetical protein